MNWLRRFLRFQRNDVENVRYGSQKEVAYESWSEEKVFRSDDTVFSTYRLLEELVVGGGWYLKGQHAEDFLVVGDELLQNIRPLLVGIVRASWNRYYIALQYWKEYEGFWIPYKWLELPKSRVGFKLSEHNEVSSVSVFTENGRVELNPLQYILYIHDPSAEEPLGRSIYTYIKNLIDVKTRIERSIAEQVQRFGSPPLIGRYRIGSSQQIQNELLNMLIKLKSSSVAVVPEGTGLELLEPKPGSAGTQLVLDLVRQMERRVARAIMGAVLAVYESEFSSRATSEVHVQLLDALLAAYQRHISDFVNDRIVRPMLAMNGKDWDVRFELVPPRLEPRSSASRWVLDLTEAGYMNTETDLQWVREYFLS